MIIRRRCDIPMARKKRLFPCDHRCSACVACIEMDEHYNESHVFFARGGDEKLRFRNAMIKMRRCDDE